MQTRPASIDTLAANFVSAEFLLRVNMRYDIQNWRRMLVLLAVLCGLTTHTRCQPSHDDAVLSGVVADPSGAKVRQARISIESSSFRHALKSDETGSFTASVPSGTYRVTISSPGFDDYERPEISLKAGEHIELSIVLNILPRREEVFVPSNSIASADPSSNLGAVSFSGSQLDLFSNDDRTMRQQLASIVGGTDENGPQIYIDGFSGGRIPPKNSIREVRINQNSFSAQYDRQGFSRIDILTKPGTDKRHGFAELIGNDDAFNARNPFTGAQPPYHTVTFDGNLTGPLGDKTSFFLSGSRLDQQSNEVVNAIDLGGAVSEAVPSPQTTNTVSARLDRQFTTNDTFTIRYEYNGSAITNGGLTPLTLPTEAYSSSTTAQTLQLGNTEIINPHTVSETRFQYIRTRVHQSPNSSLPSIIVQGAFNGGGSLGQVYQDNQDAYEFQENLSWDHAAHFIRAGGRYRLLRDSNLSTANYNGQYTFGGGTAPILGANNQPVLDQNGNVETQTISALEQYRRAVLSLPGGNASQFNITTGQPGAAVVTGDLGAYAEDDWRLRKNLTLSLGFRLESQTSIPDHFDPSPRIALSWAIPGAKGHTPLLVLRPGFALFYDRFAARNILQAVRQNGIAQQALYAQDVPYCVSTTSACIAMSGLSTASQQTIYRIDPNLRSQYDITAAITAEHTFGRHGNLSATFAPYRGVHQFLARNVNAPLPGTYDPNSPASGVRPLGGTQNIYQYSSDGYTKGRLLSVTGTWYPAKHTFVTGLYVLQKRDTDSGGASAFASQPYNVSADYGRSSFVASQRLFIGINSDLPWNFGFASYLTAHSGLPYNITTGTDLNGDTIYNDRPSFASGGGFNIAPSPTSAVIPINYGNGPDYVSWQMTFGKAFYLGPKQFAAGASASSSKQDRPYECGIAVDAINILNHVNPGTPVGVLSSPFFGKSISLAENGANMNNNAANRTLSFRTYFRF